MATYLLFWNPGISSYTQKRFRDDFSRHRYVSNWSFYEYEEVEEDDIYYMVKCGEGKTGIVARGVITSDSYESHDWSPRNRRNIYYADIEPEITINPWMDCPILSPEILTEHLPDVNWFGGHSGRRLDEATAERLDEIWYSYVDENPEMFLDGNAWFNVYHDDIMPRRIEEKFLNKSEGHCEICGYSYADIFGSELAEELELSVSTSLIPCPPLHRSYFNVCPSCIDVPKRVLVKKLMAKCKK